MGHETQRIPRGRGPPRGALGAPPELRFWALDAGAADAAAVAPASDSASAERPQVSHFVARFGFHCTPRHERSACLMEAGLQAAGGRGALQLAPERVSPPREPRPVPPPPRPPRLRSRGLRFDIRGAFSGGEWFSRTRAQPESLKGVRKQARKASGGRGQGRGWACGPCRGPASGSPRPLRHLLGCLVLRNCDKRK